MVKCILCINYEHHESTIQLKNERTLVPFRLAVYSSTNHCSVSPRCNCAPKFSCAVKNVVLLNCMCSYICSALLIFGLCENSVILCMQFYDLLLFTQCCVRFGVVIAYIDFSALY